jgi:outer membrane murein-binding lipoprotein Lpp
MQFKSITAIIVLSLVVASLLVSGCTNSTNNTNQTPSAATQHDAFLEHYLAADQNLSYADKNYSYKAWEVTWINSTSARLEDTYLNTSRNTTTNEVATYIIFPTTQDATNYLNGMNKTAYSLASTVFPSGGLYPKITGHAPQVYKLYQWNEGNPFNISEYKLHVIVQFDNMVKIGTAKQLS